MAALGAVVLAQMTPLSMRLIPWIMLGILLGIHALSLSGSFLFSFIYPFFYARQPKPAARAARVARAFLVEVVLLGRAILDMSIGSGRRAPESGVPSGGQARPVLLIHGILCNGAVWRPWREPLRAAGFAPIRAVDLEPLLGDMDAYAAQVARALGEMQRQSGGARVAIIAHSLGGLVARAALRAVGPGVVSGIVTIASPNRGVALAHLCPFPPLNALSPESPWLRALQADEVPLKVPFTCIYSLEDNLIVPARSAVIEGARIQELKGLGHVSLLGCRSSIECAVAALSAG